MFTGYIQKIRESAIASVPEKDRISLQYLMGEVKSVDLAKLPRAKGPGVAWTVDSALQILNKEVLAGRDYTNGQENVFCRPLRGMPSFWQSKEEAWDRILLISPKGATINPSWNQPFIQIWLSLNNSSSMN